MNTLNLQEIYGAMRHMVCKAIAIIQRESHEMVVEEKTAYDPTKEDCVTNADRMAQEMYIREITRQFPTCGVIAEEKELTIPCTEPGMDIYFTVDPLDGTKAYARGQSHGVGTMIALVKDGEVIAAYIGDANTGEIYGYDGDTPKGEATRYRFAREVRLQPDVDRPLDKQYVLLRDTVLVNHPLLRLFKNIEVSGGSIGTHMARIWKGEVGGVILEPGFKTPWDEAPVIGILKHLGFVFYRIDDQTPGGLVKHDAVLNKKIVRREFNLVIVHEKHEQQLLAYKYE